MVEISTWTLFFITIKTLRTRQYLNIPKKSKFEIKLDSTKVVSNTFLMSNRNIPNMQGNQNISATQLSIIFSYVFGSSFLCFGTIILDIVAIKLDSDQNISARYTGHSATQKLFCRNNFHPDTSQFSAMWGECFVIDSCRQNPSDLSRAKRKNAAPSWWNIPFGSTSSVSQQILRLE